MRFEMPLKGRDWDTLREEMRARRERDVKWRDGKTAVYTYHTGEDEIDRVQKEAYNEFMSENGLGPLAFPSIAQMESEIVSMGLSLLHAPEGAMGNVTSGGTDSITMAIKTARDYARATGKLKGPGNIVAPWSAHPAFDKAAQLMDLEVRRIPCRDLLADVDKMAEAIDENTIMIMGSAPCYPYGLIDPIEELGKLAQDRDVWMHVDACVGGYFAPFARMNGEDIPPFDFEVPGVMSMSADLHKLGYAPKGASTVFFRNEELHSHMICHFENWPGGKMVTPTLAGTRPGGSISGAWGVMNFLGVEGYRKRQGLICETRKFMEAELKTLGFEILGEPKLCILAFAHPDYDSFMILGKLMERGWITAVSTEPRALHMLISPIHAKAKDQYLSDLKDVMGEIDAGQLGQVAEGRYS